MRSVYGFDSSRLYNKPSAISRYRVASQALAKTLLGSIAGSSRPTTVMTNKVRAFRGKYGAALSEIFSECRSLVSPNVT
jgi:hypothetical protein